RPPPTAPAAPRATPPACPCRAPSRPAPPRPSPSCRASCPCRAETAACACRAERAFAGRERRWERSWLTRGYGSRTVRSLWSDRPPRRYHATHLSACRSSPPRPIPGILGSDHNIGEGFNRDDLLANSLHQTFLTDFLHRVEGFDTAEIKTGARLEIADSDLIGLV